MAIIDPFEVTILVDGESATEYDDSESLSESNDFKTLTKYVEVKSGSSFAFKFTVLPSYRPGNRMEYHLVTPSMAADYAGSSSEKSWWIMWMASLIY